MEPPLLSVVGLCKRFGATQALDGVDFALDAGEVHTLVGENGAGKSTLIKILGGVYPADGGEIMVDGQPASFVDPRDSIGRGIVVIPQEMQLVPGCSIAENVMLGAWPTKRWLGFLQVIDKATMLESAGRALEQLDFRGDLDLPVEILSFAERQLVAIARALAQQARVLVLDEPTASLEQREARRLFDIIAGLKQRGVSIIYVSHRLEEIVALADRCTVLRDGRVVDTLACEDVNEERLIRSMTGRDLDELRRPHRTDFGPTHLAVERSGTPVSVREGEIVGLAGLLGSGTAELLSHLFGAGPEPARVELHGTARTIRRPAEAIAARIGLVPGERRLGLVMGMSVRDNVVLPNIATLAGRMRLDTRQIDRLVKGLMESLDIRPRNLALPVGQLSGGNQQKVVFARWLASHVDTLLLIEPTQGIDIGAKARIHHLMRDFVEDRGAVLLASSEMVEVVNMSDAILAMRKGAIVGRLAPELGNFNEGSLRAALGG